MDIHNVSSHHYDGENKLAWSLEMGNSKRHVYKRGALNPIQRGVKPTPKAMNISPN